MFIVNVDIIHFWTSLSFIQILSFSAYMCNVQYLHVRYMYFHANTTCVSPCTLSLLRVTQLHRVLSV